jgi:hypothetical protein
MSSDLTPEILQEATTSPLTSSPDHSLSGGVAIANDGTSGTRKSQEDDRLPPEKNSLGGFAGAWRADET